MLPFSIALKPGEPVYEQVVFAVTRAIVSGQLQPGDDFPSVRALSQELRINPNTAHKAVATLVGQGLLEVRPGIGTVVSTGGPVSKALRRTLLKDHVERLVVEAKRLGLDFGDLTEAIRRHWANTSNRLKRAT